MLPPARRLAASPRVPPEGPALFASHDAASLTALLARTGAPLSSARATAAKVIRHVYRGLSAHGPRRAPEHGSPWSVPAWDERALAELGVGAWARASLLELSASLSLAVAEQALSSDDTVRLALRARDGALIESVIIPGPARATLCVSSQVGCARACSFCETGRLGLLRQLSAGEIIDQVRIALSLHRGRGGARPPLQNLVFMGMGEPLDNLAEVTRAIRLLTDPLAFGFAPSRVTVSTVGVVDKIQSFFEACRAELAVSLNAPDDARRSAIMPVNARAPLGALRGALLEALPPGRRVLFEYVLFEGFNDALSDAEAVGAYVAGLPCRVNVIPCNPGPDPALKVPSAERLDAFVKHLSGLGVTTLVRRPRGRDVGGACGQLAGSLRSSLPVVARS